MPTGLDGHLRLVTVTQSTIVGLPLYTDQVLQELKRMTISEFKDQYQLVLKIFAMVNLSQTPLAYNCYTGLTSNEYMHK